MNDKSEKSLRRRLFDELMSTTCQCGALKRTKFTFCPKCYFFLPRRLRFNLYQPLGNGYEDAYQEAVAYLRAKQLGLQT